MQRRRERIERWRQERKKTVDMTAMKAEALQQAEALAQSTGKKWSLEDDDDVDDEADDEAEDEVSFFNLFFNFWFPQDFSKLGGILDTNF